MAATNAGAEAETGKEPEEEFAQGLDVGRRSLWLPGARALYSRGMHPAVLD